MSRLSDYLAQIAAWGGDVERWKAAFADTKACAATARGQARPIDRMKAYYDCRKGKKLEKA